MEKYFQLQGVKLDDKTNGWEYKIIIPTDSSYCNEGVVTIPWEDLNCFGDLEEAIENLSTLQIELFKIDIFPACKKEESQQPQ